MSLQTPVTARDVKVAVFGRVAPADSDYARTKIAHALKHAPRPVLYVRVNLTRLQTGDESSSVARANVDLNGRVVHAEATRATMHEAIDELQDRVRDRIEHVVHE